jgi:hypothetical protein
MLQPSRPKLFGRFTLGARTHSDDFDAASPFFDYVL